MSSFQPRSSTNFEARPPHETSSRQLKYIVSAFIEVQLFGMPCCNSSQLDAVVYCMQVYVVGGLQTNMTTYAPFIETYDSLLDQWEVPALPADIEPRAFAAVCSL